MLLPLILAFGATCDVPGEPPTPTTAEQRRDTYALVREDCKALGAAPAICETMVAMAWRETRGRPTLVHTRGKNEYGLGLFAHAPRFWRFLWLPLPRYKICDPHVAIAALLREFQRSYRQGARRIMHLQRPHAGRRPTDDSRPYADARFCYLLEHGPRDDQHVVSWSVDCKTRITRDDLGTPIDDDFMKAWAG
jgi:hypothetical protein